MTSERVERSPPKRARLGPAGANVHFDERPEGDRLVFDDTLRPVVVRQRNALAVMRTVGINV